MAPHILLLSAPFGSGHLQAARALADAFRTEAPDCETQVVDIHGLILEGVSSGYLSLTRHVPSAYRRLYHTSVNETTRKLVRTVLHRPVLEAIAGFQPTAVIATHPFPGAVAAHLRRSGQLQATVAMAVTDFCPHPFWVEPGVDRYFVPSAPAAHRLLSLGVEPASIRVTGIPIRPDFAPCRPDGGAAPRVLVMGGSLGLGPIVEAVRSLLALPQRHLAVTVVTGTNEHLAEELRRLCGTDRRFEILGFTDQIPRLMAEAALLITKPGGVTCAEALACGVPMLLLQPLPGHEEENAAYLTGTGAAAAAVEESIGAQAAELLFDRPDKLARMKEAARLAGRPRAALDIARETLEAHHQLPRHSDETDTQTRWPESIQMAGSGG